MVDIEAEGRRPKINPSHEVGPDALRVCPGVGLAHAPAMPGDPYIPELRSAWGPVLGVWEGYAADPEIRYSGSSGGAATALALYCLEVGGMKHVLHTAARSDAPYLNETVTSRTRADLLRATGSRYAPASPCDGLQTIEDAGGHCVFIGKPCDVAGVQKACKLRPRLDENLGVTIGFFCAGTPSTRGTLELLRRMGVEEPSSLVSLRYRGNGWPGKATAVFRTKRAEESRDLTYQESWGDVLSKHQQWRCKLCADHTGEFADIAVGDPWYRTIEEGEPGRSLILARTERGAMLVLAAAKAGFLEVHDADPGILPSSQPNLLRARGALWGRLLACQLLCVSYPKYVNIPLFKHWCVQLNILQKLKSVLGTIRRILTRNTTLDLRKS
ncbi:MAG: Coenzyme F420 hydrogenase/dehydrogenase, beta subunit C-terminal domain [Candidatus Hydrogenedentes bacterium]|nr:Coenzyme F420 hydrogenase/dehydrogenase, beta subunit C-terminal domain [Candidatus Hydrogenedentota bacterium]